MMKIYLLQFLQDFSFEQDCQNAVLDAYDRLQRHHDAFQTFLACINEYEQNRLCDFPPIIQTLSALSQQTNVHEYTLCGLFYLCLTKPLKTYYAQRGVHESIWADTVTDLLYKFNECKSVKGVWGVFAIKWFFNLFRMNVFKLGRLEFCRRTFATEYEKDGLVLHPGDAIIDTHIPSSSPLVHDQALQSYRQATRFFKDFFQWDTTVFWCHSWLLFPDHRSALKPQSNIAQFMDDFDIYERGEYDNYNEVCMRLFGRDYAQNSDISTLPSNTSLQRFYKQRMLENQPTGYGVGVFDFKRLQ